jgi:hypothetical protein
MHTTLNYPQDGLIHQSLRRSFWFSLLALTIRFENVIRVVTMIPCETNTKPQNLQHAAPVPSPISPISVNDLSFKNGMKLPFS